MPSARTSVGNKEYEYKDNNQRAASLQQAGNRQKTVSIGDAAVAVALRHEIETTAVRLALSTLFSAYAKFRIKWTYRRPDVQMKFRVLSSRKGSLDGWVA
ncbi:hypothetical protein PY254_03710 [Rhodanobacter sp. AS-Z3]|uniref:hypothetical protein n=1 Tax=Rhodanobacter sp. AS-Z3 TaxID=3031330 RepID=UPI00247A8A4D|nr:hypothetical protein [Rhodanobacter sp. AS-Z3]WEN15790.1 hypothetical protein PY254_03710 [Rhodanobacter sp. AS-Z3]